MAGHCLELCQCAQGACVHRLLGPLSVRGGQWGSSGPLLPRRAVHPPPSAPPKWRPVPSPDIPAVKRGRAHGEHLMSSLTNQKKPTKKQKSKPKNPPAAQRGQGACLGPQSKLGAGPVWKLGILTPRHTHVCEQSLHACLLPKMIPCHINVSRSRHNHHQPCPAV